MKLYKLPNGNQRNYRTETRETTERKPEKLPNGNQRNCRTAFILPTLRSFGYFFEALAVRDLRIYMDAVMGHVERYHDSTGLECDAVLQARDGSYALVEIKTGGNLIDEGIETLSKFDSLIAKKKMRPPAFRMILTAIGEFAYTRPKDNIIICPIGCLKP